MDIVKKQIEKKTISQKAIRDTSRNIKVQDTSCTDSKCDVTNTTLVVARMCTSDFDLIACQSGSNTEYCSTITLPVDVASTWISDCI
jgi:hypothetical protein